MFFTNMSFYEYVFSNYFFKKFDYKIILEQDDSFMNLNDIISDAISKITLNKITGIIFFSLKREFINIINETILNTCHHFIYRLAR